MPRFTKTEREALNVVISQWQAGDSISQFLGREFHDGEKMSREEAKEFRQAVRLDAALASAASKVNGHRPPREDCSRCGRGVPPRMRDTGFCSIKCAEAQAVADRLSADMEAENA